jgi:hypothetical protein
MFRSTKLCGAIATLLVTEQLEPDATTQLNAVSAMLPAGPERSVTVTVFDCCEYTASFVATHPSGTHVSAGAVSVVLPFGLFTE